MSSSPLKLGRSSKLRMKSPCSPQAVGVADADVLLAVRVVTLELDMLERSVVVELKVEPDDDVTPWLCVDGIPLELDPVVEVDIFEPKDELIDEVAA